PPGADGRPAAPVPLSPGRLLPATPVLPFGLPVAGRGKSGGSPEPVAPRLSAGASPRAPGGAGEAGPVAPGVPGTSEKSEPPRGPGPTPAPGPAGVPSPPAANGPEGEPSVPFPPGGHGIGFPLAAGPANGPEPSPPACSRKCGGSPEVPHTPMVRPCGVEVVP